MPRLPSPLEILYGTDEPIAGTLSLRAGPLHLQLQQGRLWDLRVGGTEVWHGMAFVYRDAEWGTPEPVIEAVESTVSTHAFRVSCAGHFPATPLPLPFRLEIEGREDGFIRFAAEAVPLADIQTNRLGLCLLHPMSVAGARVAIEHVDGRQSLSTFPRLVPPWPPFMLIRAVRHEYAPNHWARCEFEGDLFELEDQRNNADASFKTYSRSNLMPRPYWLRAGVPVRQSAELWVEGRSSTPSLAGPAPVRITLGQEVRQKPAIGIEVLPDGLRVDSAVRAALASLRPAHLHLAVDRHCTALDWRSLADLIAASGARLRLDLRLDGPRGAAAAAAELAGVLQAAGIEPESIAVFPSETACLAAVRQTFPHSSVGGGTPDFFVQLHRAERLGPMDFLSFTTSPIVHGTRESEMMAGLQSLPSLVETLRGRYPIPMRIGPSTLGARNSPLGAQPASDGSRRITLAQMDPRCRGLFGAAWCLGYVEQFQRAGVQSLTLLSLTGHSALVEPQPAGDLIRHPPYHLLTRLCAPGRLREVRVNAPGRIAALALERGEHTELLLANLTGEPMDIELEVGPRIRSVSRLDLETWPGVRSAPDPWEALRQQARSASHRIGAYGLFSCLLEEPAPEGPIV